MPMLDGRARRGHGPGREEATALAIDALGFLAGDPDRLSRFLALTGLEAHELRAAASEPSFFVALLDFILADEATVLDFAASSSIRPERIGEARRALAGRDFDGA